MSLAQFMTKSFDLYRPDGAGNLILIEGGIACTPADLLSGAIAQMYPFEEVLRMRQTFTKSAAMEHDDRIDLDGINYIVQNVMRFELQGGMDAYTQILLEEILSA